MRSAFVLLACVAACSDDDTDPPIDAAVVDSQVIDTMFLDGDPPDGPVLALTLTSTAITEGGVIPDLYSCQGTNVSPPLTWTGPAASSYAVVLTDLTGNPLIHSIIYDIPAAVTSLPENVMKVAEPPVPLGSKQPFAYNNTTRGYLGPCPGSMHTYQFAVFALDVATLPGLTLASNRAQVKAAILAHDTATGTLTATFTP